MTTYYTCTEVTFEVYSAYVKHCPSDTPYSFDELLAVTLSGYAGITIYPVRRYMNERHLTEFGSQSDDAEINILVSVEEFFSQLFLLELDQ